MPVSVVWHTAVGNVCVLVTKRTSLSAEWRHSTKRLLNPKPESCVCSTFDKCHNFYMNCKRRTLSHPDLCLSIFHSWKDVEEHCAVVESCTQKDKYLPTKPQNHQSGSVTALSHRVYWVSQMIKTERTLRDTLWSFLWGRKHSKQYDCNMLTYVQCAKTHAKSHESQRHQEMGLDLKTLSSHIWPHLISNAQCYSRLAYHLVWESNAAWWRSRRPRCKKYPQKAAAKRLLNLHKCLSTQISPHSNHRPPNWMQW